MNKICKMKTTLIFMMVLCFFYCKKSDTEPKHFNPVDLSKLSLESIDSFWGNDSIIALSNYFHNQTKYLGGINLRNNGFKSIGVAVFESQDLAINAMEGRIDNVAVRIREGLPNATFPGKWWYSNGSAIFINQNNTIVEVLILDSPYNDVEQLLTETAAEITKRIDQLSK